MVGRLQRRLPVPFLPMPKEILMTILSSSHPLRVLFASVVIAVIAGGFGCADGEIRLGDPFDREHTLTEAQHRYTVFVRWADFEKARSFVAVDDRDSFMEQTKILEDAHLTEWDSEPVDIDTEKEAATVRVTYKLYTASSPYEVEIIETQEWTRSGVGNNWSVYSTFEGLQQLASN
jgi:hypothetical protein